MKRKRKDREENIKWEYKGIGGIRMPQKEITSREHDNNSSVL